MARSTRWIASASTAAAVGLVLPFAFAIPAYAHDGLTASTPAADSTVSSVEEVRLVFSDELLDLGASSRSFGINVTDSDGAFYQTACVTLDGNEVSAPAALGDPGTYTVTWQVISSDAHVTSDSYDFTYAPAAGTASAPGSQTAPTCGTDTAIAQAEQEKGDIVPGLLIAGAVFVILVIAAGLFVVVRGRRRAKKTDNLSMDWLNEKHGHEKGSRDDTTD